MADTKISALSAGTAAPGDEIPVNRGGSNFKITAGDILKINGGTITANSPVLDLTQTWNNAAVTFTGLKFNATDTTSASGSLLMDLQVGGTSKFYVNKLGEMRITGASMGSSNTTMSLVAGSIGILGLNATGIGVRVAHEIGFSSSTDTTAARDTLFTRKDAASLQLGAADAAAPVAQTLGPQSVVAGTSNTAGANFTIRGSQGTGTGSGGSLLFQVAPAGSSGTAQNSLVTFLEATSTRAFNLYNTANITSNYERAKIAWESNVLKIGTEKAGTGTARALELQTDGNTRLTISGLGNLTVNDGNGLAFGTVNGTKIGTATSQKLAFWNAAPIVQPVNSTAIDTLLVNTGLRASGGTANFATAIETSSTIKTGAPTGGTAAAWKLGAVASVSPTSPNRTIEVDIGGTIYYLHAKTTND